MDFRNEALLALEGAADRASSLFRRPTIRLGVTGLSRAGKTVFITALVQNLVHCGRLPGFKAFSSGRIARVWLEPQPDNLVPRFQYEQHLQSLLGKRKWPDSTRSISELRLTVEFESESFWQRRFGSNLLSLDIIDYPGEWLLDLALMDMSYGQWCAETHAQAMLPNRAELSAPWREAVASIDPAAPADEHEAQQIHDQFAAYLIACREDKTALSALPPGRFLMPGDMAGAPALTFAPLALQDDSKPAANSWHALMKNRFDAYKSEIVYPFYREHFARIDRQIVLVDALQAINAGPYAIADLKNALSGILGSFKVGGGGFLSSFVRRRIDRIIFAATKADHVHHSDHDKLANLLGVLVEDAKARAEFSGADVKTVALSAVRTTREAKMNSDGEDLPVLIGTPAKGETLDGKMFDGDSEAAVFPGDLPASARMLMNTETGEGAGLNFVRFRPPVPTTTMEGNEMALPHIRLDETLEFLLGDKLA
jgi:hypothetical protein